MREEILALLLSHYPDPVQAREIVQSLERRSAGSVRNTLGQMWKEKALHRVPDNGYVLTNSGLREAQEIVSIYARVSLARCKRSCKINRAVGGITR